MPPDADCWDAWFQGLGEALRLRAPAPQRERIDRSAYVPPVEDHGNVVEWPVYPDLGGDID
jgi:hypothetical protein